MEQGPFSLARPHFGKCPLYIYYVKPTGYPGAQCIFKAQGGAVLGLFLYILPQNGRPMPTAHGQDPRPRKKTCGVTY